jgi:glycosyltransferase involved in cell wall biosynthesis
MQNLGVTFEVVFVEDNGHEDSWQELLRIKNLYPNTTTIIKLTRNYGQNGSTLCGIDEAKGDVIITLDDDLQIHPIEIKKLIEFHELNDCDVVYGKLEDNHNTFIRKAGSSFIKKFFKSVEGENSIGSSFRLMNSFIGSRLKQHSQDHLYINQVISWYTTDIGFVAVEHNPRIEGSSGYNLLNLIFLTFRILFYYTSIPLKIIAILCGSTALVSLAYALYFSYYHLSRDNYFDVVTMALYVCTSLVMVSVAVLSIYINRIYTSREKKPNYSIKVKL